MDELSLSICWTELPYHICLLDLRLLEKTARWPRPKALANVPPGTWITHGIHARKKRHTKYYKGKTFSFVLSRRFRTLN